MNKNPDALIIDHLNVSYGKTPVLWDITLRIPTAQIVGIIGPNGAGKSTLLKAILGLVVPLAGKVTLLGSPPAAVRGLLAYVPQRGAVDWDFPLTVRELVLMGRYGRLGLLKRPRRADREAAEAYLDKVGLTPYADRQISQLSGGQQQRAFLARALMQEAEIYFFDEPFAGIDIASESTVMEILRQLAASGKTIFVVHHDLTSVEAYFDWVIMLNMRLVACGPTHEAFNGGTLHATYGKSYSLFEEVLKLSQNKTAGLET